jgi:hypothetical protein
MGSVCRYRGVKGSMSKSVELVAIAACCGKTECQGRVAR